MDINICGAYSSHVHVRVCCILWHFHAFFATFSFLRLFCLHSCNFTDEMLSKLVTSSASRCYLSLAVKKIRMTGIHVVKSKLHDCDRWGILKVRSDMDALCRFFSHILFLFTVLFPFSRFPPSWFCFFIILIIATR